METNYSLPTVSLCQDAKEGLGEKNSKKVRKESPVVIIPRPVTVKSSQKAVKNAPVHFTQALQDLIPKFAASFNNNSPKSPGSGRFHQRGLTRKNEQLPRQFERGSKVEVEKAVLDSVSARPQKPIIPERPPYKEETFKKELTISLQKYTENFYKNPANYDIKEQNGNQKIIFDGIIPDDAETLSKGDVALLWLEETLADIREQYTFKPATKALLADPKPTDRGETALIW